MALVKRQIEKELADYSYLNVPTVKPSFDFLNICATVPNLSEAD